MNEASEQHAVRLGVFLSNSQIRRATLSEERAQQLIALGI